MCQHYKFSDSCDWFKISSCCEKNENKRPNGMEICEYKEAVTLCIQHGYSFYRMAPVAALLSV